MYDQIIQGFQPLIDLMQIASYPISLGMIIAGGCTYSIGNELQAKKMIKGAIIGYLIVQFAPGIMTIVHTASKGLSVVK